MSETSVQDRVVRIVCDQMGTTADKITKETRGSTKGRGKVPGGSKIPIKWIRKIVETLSEKEEKELVFYCKSCTVSTQAAYDFG